MTLFEKLAGGAFGVILGGCIGALLLRVTSKETLPRGKRKVSGPLDERACKRAAFAVAITCLAAKVAKADSLVTQDEIRAFDLFLRNSLHLSRNDREDAARIFNEARDSSTPASEYALQLGKIFKSDPDRLRDTVTILLTIALSDGHIHTDEEELIRRIARDMGLSSADYRSCSASFHALRGDAKVCPYEILGVERTASNDEIRAAHRRMVREYHPDVLQSKGLPDDFLAFAKEKLQAANDAWASLKAVRGN